MTPPGGIELLFLLVFPLLPVLLAVYVVVLLRDIRSGVRDLNARTSAIEQRLQHQADHER